MGKEIILQSMIICSECGYPKEETMPTEACQFFFDCEKCHTISKPKQGDCCVYCSFGTNSCPPVQESGKNKHSYLKCFPSK